MSRRAAAEAAGAGGGGARAAGTPGPVPVPLEVRRDAVPDVAPRGVLTDPESTPLAVLDIAERSEVQAPRHARDAAATRLTRLSGPVTGLREPEHGPFRRLMRRPAEAREALGDGPVLAFATRGPVHSRQIGQLRHLASQLKARLLLLPLIAGPAEVVTRPEALVRAVLAAAASLPPATMVIPVPLAARGPASGTGPARELSARALVAAAYGATHLMADPGPPPPPPPAPPPTAPPADGPGTAIPVVRAGDWAYDPGPEGGRAPWLIEAGTGHGG